jgi:hypothetical protein
MPQAEVAGLERAVKSLLSLGASYNQVHTRGIAGIAALNSILTRCKIRRHASLVKKV